MGSSQHEVLVGAGSLKNHRRKLVIIACYIPPTVDKSIGAACLEHISDTVTEIKRRYRDPYVLVAGDFNDWKIDGALADFADIREVEVGPTRGRRSIERIFVNFARSVTESGTLAPLETEDRRGGVGRSDHRVAFCRARLERMRTFKWESYTSRRYTEEAENKYKEWLVMHDWSEVFSVDGSNNKTNAYQDTLDWSINEFFPLRTTRRKTTDLPWIGKGTKKLIRNRKRLFMEEGGLRTSTWKEEKKGSTRLLKGGRESTWKIRRNTY